MNTNISWNTPKFDNYKTYESIQKDVFELWDLISVNDRLPLDNLDEPKEVEQTVNNLLGEVRSKFEKLQGNYDDDYKTECGLAIQIIKSCDGSDTFFNTVDKIEYYSSNLKWALRDYIKDIMNAERGYEDVIDNLKSSAIKTIKRYTELNQVPFNTTIGETHKYYNNLITQWKSNPCLEMLWADRDYHNLSWEGDKTAFYTLFILAKNTFVELIQKFEDPYSITMALHAIDSEITVEIWSFLVANAKTAFDNKGTWDHNELLLPLLMHHTDFKLSVLINSYNINTTSNQSKLDEIKQRLDELVTFIIHTLFNVQPLGTLRWILYQLRDLRNDEIIVTIDKSDGELPKTYSYLKSKFILSFSSLFDYSDINSSETKLVTWSDSLDYEEWFAHVFLSLYIETRLSSNADAEPSIQQLKVFEISNDFFSRWYFDIKNWYCDEGLLFRKESSDFSHYDDNFSFKKDKYYFLSYLLFVSIKHNKSLDIWNKLLLSSDLFLDILEYQKYRDSNWNFDNHSHSRYALSLLSIVGLNLITLLANDKNELALYVYNSFYQMVFKAFESDTISKKYFSAIKLLSFLRLNAEIDDDSNFKNLNQSYPSIEDYLYDFQPHDIEFFEILYFLKDNGLKSDFLSLLVAGKINVNINQKVSSLNKMIEIDKKRFTFSNEFKNFLSSLGVLTDLTSSNQHL
ncbi:MULTISPECIES: hypothetical protein [unclassified Psychrobacter]|uniref:hypothetical protein n=2 Tax=Moraxellaceae TaxID=468 RepID=UPI00086B4FF5|nr:MULTISPECIES: hypothetical protein [unclassified Psychrobacter]OEH66904.1 MAG: hypothetical protein BAX61_07880 [Psychrobacter sp. B29-1]PKH55104.1 hypothetical protein CXF69_01145 [Psychrobacter sp. Choline-02u-9]|tara:strand:+ start:2485 stop:4539 length:2055 start_codon:yes stop_codon:yes gene_type:complete